MNDIDGIVATVPRANKQAYIEHAPAIAAVFQEYGRSSRSSAGVTTFPRVKSRLSRWR